MDEFSKIGVDLGKGYFQVASYGMSAYAPPAGSGTGKSRART